MFFVILQMIISIYNFLIMRIGIFLGSFDPIHNGHIADIISVLNDNLVDRVCIVPAYQNPWKNKASAAYDIRVKMCALVAHELNKAFYDTCSSRIFVSDVEKRIKETDHYSYLVLQELKEMFKDDELVLVCGTDVAQSIKDWKNGDWILSNFSVIELHRSTSNNSDEVGVNISSTKIREMVSEGKCPLGFVPSSVFEEIKKFNLYLNK